MNNRARVEASLGMKVLVLDDRPEDRELMTILLGHAGHDVIEAADGDAALELVRRQRPELIITDLLMPGMNGYELVRRVREDADLGTTPVIFCTANYLEKEARDLAAACGVARFISKPYSPEVVRETVEEALRDTEPLPHSGLPGPEFEHELLRVINDKLVEKVTELERVSEHRQHLLGLIMSAQEDERQRIADGIHDDSLQTVVAVGLALANVRRRIDDEQALKSVERLQALLKLAAQRLRSLLFELRPTELQNQGLVAALRAYLEHVQREEGLEFTVDDQLESAPEPELETFIYRIVQELLINVRKHAGASRVDVKLSMRAGRHAITVRDDGVGFDVDEALRARPGHLGLAALTERMRHAGGMLRVQSTPGNGAIVELELPPGILT